MILHPKRKRHRQRIKNQKVKDPKDKGQQKTKDPKNKRQTTAKDKIQHAKDPKDKRQTSAKDKRPKDDREGK